MESKHFSHHHPLVFHQVPQGSQAHCSGCKSPASGNVFVCWQCNYFLHEQCYRAARSFHHPSHPHHPLTLVPFPTYPSANFFCNSCNLAGDGFSYSCSACEFDIHLHCALAHNQHLSPSPHNYPQNPVYPPPNPIHSTYPPQPQTYLPPPQTQSAQAQPQNQPQTYPPPPQAQSAQAQPQPQPQTYPPLPQAPSAQAQPPPAGYPPNQHYPSPQNYAPTAPTDSTVVNATPTTAANPPPPQPAVPQSKPPSIIKHFSHPHVLKLMEIEKKNAKVCSACECELSGSAYCCTEPFCTFNLHKSCFDSPSEVTHKSHLQHPLTLLATPPYSDGFTCNACLKDGKAFAYNCAKCSYDLHIDCIQWPDKVNRPDHEHNLTLYYSSPAAEASEQAAFICDVCKNPVHEMAWMYYCRECDFGTHLECVTSGIQQQQSATSSEEEALLIKFAVLNLLLGEKGRKAAIDNI